MVALLHAGQHGTTAEGGQPASGFADPLGAELPLRVFREDVLLCSCGGRRVVLAFITEKKVVKVILEYLGLPTTGPPISPARTSAAGEDTPWQDDLPELQQSLR